MALTLVSPGSAEHLWNYPICRQRLQLGLELIKNFLTDDDLVQWAFGDVVYLLIVTVVFYVTGNFG